MPWFKKISLNTFYQIIARIITSGTSFIIALLLLRQFGMSTYGDFAKVTAFVSVFYLFVDFGFNAIFLQHDHEKVHFKDLFYPRLLGGVAIAIIASLLGMMLPYNPLSQTGFSPVVRMGIVLFSITILTEGLLYTAMAVFQRELQYHLYLFAAVVGSLLSLVLVSVIILLRLPFSTVFPFLVVGAVVESVVALVLTKQTLSSFSVDTAFIKKLFIQSFPITMMLLFNVIYFRIDMFLLAFFRPSTDVAVYDLSYKFFDFLVALPLFLSNALYPKILEDVRKNDISKLSWQYVSAFLALSILVVIPVWLCAPLLVLIRADFANVVLPLRLLVVSLPVFFATNILQWLLIALSRQKFLSMVYILAAVLTIALNIIFIPRYGYVASAIITGVSEALVAILFCFQLASVRA